MAISIDTPMTIGRPVARGVQGVLENPPFYEPPFLEKTNPPIASITTE